MSKKEPTSLYGYLFELSREWSSDKLNQLLEKAKNPPYLIKYDASLKAYIAEVRDLQKIVREQVNLKLRITETEGASFDYLFDSSYDAVEKEFQQWGLGSLNDNIYFRATGHRWVTVASAHFKKAYQSKYQSSLEKIKIKRDILGELYVPLGIVAKSIDDYASSFRLFECLFDGCFNQLHLLNTERDRLDDYNKQFLKDTDFVRKGILSLSMVHGMVYHLEKSSDMAWNHPGD